LDEKLEVQNIEIPEVEVETGAVTAEEPVEISGDITIETNKEKKAREKKETKAQKGAKKQAKAEKRNTKSRKFIRRLLIWSLAILLIFLAGFAVSHFMFVSRPANAALEQAKADLAAAEVEITSLQSEVDDLSPLEVTNASLQIEVADVNTHITILSARVSVTDALLALQDGNLAEVSLELDKMETTLKTLKTMLNTDQREVVTIMEQRLDLVMGELDEDTTAAGMDLEVLSVKLTSLENTLFANP